MKKFTKEELEAYKKKLLLMRARLRGDVTSLSSKADEKNKMVDSGSVSTSPIHLADAGSDNFDQEFSLSLVEIGSGRLKEINAALERIENGSFGICEECGVRITKKRLEAIPYTDVCIDCANERAKNRW